MSASDLNVTRKLCEKFSSFDRDVKRYIEENIDRTKVLGIFHYAAVRSIEQDRGNIELAKFIVKSLKEVLLQPGTIVLNFDSDYEEGMHRNVLYDPDSLLVELFMLSGKKGQYKWRDLTPFLMDFQDEFDIDYIQISGEINPKFNTHIILGDNIEFNGQDIGNGDMIVENEIEIKTRKKAKKTTMKSYTKEDYKGEQHLVIPDEYTSIEKDALEGCDSLISVVIPDSVTSIGKYAFYKCYSLTSVDIPDSVTYIGEHAFRRCYSLKSIDIPDSVTRIRKGAFAECASLEDVTIPGSVTEIGDDAFEKCTSLKDVTIFNSVTYIGKGAFWGCSSLKDVTIPDSVTSIDWGTFEKCTSLESIVIPDSVTEIGNNAFEGCTSLKGVTIPDSVNVIGQYAFRECTSLTSIVIPGSVTKIGAGVFYKCDNLKVITLLNPNLELSLLPPDVKVIREYQQLDKIMGMICAHALGDALGAPHEFRYQKKNYNGKLEHDVIMRSRWQPDVTMPPGVVTDDTQMSFALMRSIIEKGKFDRDDVIKAYMNWANSGVKSLGRNTRSLFKGVKTVKGYENRYKKTFPPGEEVTQSNGSLMRAYPLIFVKNPKLDTELTNPNPVNILCTEIYVRLLKDAFNNVPKKDTVKWLKNIQGAKTVKTAIKEAIEKKDRDIEGKDKGWVVHALYAAIYGYLHFDNFTDMYEWIIKKWGDTDTNAAIAGAVKGAELGYNRLLEEEGENLQILFQANPTYFDDIETESLELTDFLD